LRGVQEPLPPFSLLSWVKSYPLLLVVPLPILSCLILFPLSFIQFALQVLKGQIMRIHIDETGIRIFNTLWPWRRVRQFWGQTDKSGRRVKLRCRLMWWRVVLPIPENIWTEMDFDEGRYESLIAELQPFLAEKHPHVKLGPLKKKTKGDENPVSR
jgi:hypothetical protein